MERFSRRVSSDCLDKERVKTSLLLRQKKSRPAPAAVTEGTKGPSAAATIHHVTTTGVPVSDTPDLFSPQHQTTSTVESNTEMDSVTSAAVIEAKPRRGIGKTPPFRETDQDLRAALTELERARREFESASKSTEPNPRKRDEELVEPISRLRLVYRYARDAIKRHGGVL